MIQCVNSFKRNSSFWCCFLLSFHICNSENKNMLHSSCFWTLVMWGVAPSKITRSLELFLFPQLLCPLREMWQSTRWIFLSRCCCVQQFSDKAWTGHLFCYWMQISHHHFSEGQERFSRMCRRKMKLETQFQSKRLLKSKSALKEEK